MTVPDAMELKIQALFQEKGLLHTKLTCPKCGTSMRKVSAFFRCSSPCELKLSQKYGSIFFDTRLPLAVWNEFVTIVGVSQPVYSTARFAL